MAMNKDNPHFSMEELRQIYAAAQEKTRQGMRDAAARLYSDKADALNTLYWIKGGGRAFRSSDGNCYKPAYTLQSWPSELAVMEDGTLLDY